MTTFTVELDFAYGEDFDDDLELLFEEVDTLHAYILTHRGPTGWPLVRFDMATWEMGAFAAAYGMELDELVRLGRYLGL